MVKVMFEKHISDPLDTVTAILSGSKWSVLLLRTVLKDAMGRFFHFLPGDKDEGLCG